MSRSSEKRSYKYTDAKRWAENQEGSISYLKLPSEAKLLKTKVGTMLLDIIPYEVGKGNPGADEGAIHWELTFWVHRGIGANSETVICPARVLGERCPICEGRVKLLRDPDDEAEELAKDLAPRKRQLMNVIDLKGGEDSIQLFETSFHLFGKALQARVLSGDEQDHYEAFFHLEDGYSVRATFEEESFGGRTFPKAEIVDFKPRRDDYGPDILDEAFKLEDLLVIHSYDKLKSLYLQSSDEDSRDRRREDKDNDDRRDRRDRREEGKDSGDRREDRRDEREDRREEKREEAPPARRGRGRPRKTDAEKADAAEARSRGREREERGSRERDREDDRGRGNDRRDERDDRDRDRREDSRGSDRDESRGRREDSRGDSRRDSKDGPDEGARDSRDERRSSRDRDERDDRREEGRSRREGEAREDRRDEREDRGSSKNRFREEGEDRPRVHSDDEKGRGREEREDRGRGRSEDRDDRREEKGRDRDERRSPAKDEWDEFDKK